jgi:hypothetical protein
MPKLNPVAIIAASVAFYLIGFLWYGLLFSDAWMAAHGVTAEDAKAQSPIWMAAGFVITVVQVAGLATVLKWKGAASLVDAAKAAALLWAFFALPFSLYNYIYLPSHGSTLLMVDASHLLVGWVVSAIVLSLFK